MRGGRLTVSWRECGVCGGWVSRRKCSVCGGWVSRAKNERHVWTCGWRGVEGAGGRTEGTRRRVAVCQRCGRELSYSNIARNHHAAGGGAPKVGQAADGDRLAMDWIGLVSLRQKRFFPKKS